MTPEQIKSLADIVGGAYYANKRISPHLSFEFHCGSIFEFVSAIEAHTHVLLQQAFDAAEKMRTGMIQMRENAEAYGEAFARACVKEYRDLAPGSAEEKFRALSAMQMRMSDYADGVTAGYDAIQALKTELAKPEPGPRDSAS